MMSEPRTRSFAAGLMVVGALAVGCAPLAHAGHVRTVEATLGLAIDTVPGWTTAIHPIPNALAVPVGIELSLMLDRPPVDFVPRDGECASCQPEVPTLESIHWAGAEEGPSSMSHAKLGYLGQGVVEISGAGPIDVSVRAVLLYQRARLRVVRTETVRLFGVNDEGTSAENGRLEVWVDPVVVREPGAAEPGESVHEQTMDYFFGESIADIRRLGADHYRTSVDRTVRLNLSGSDGRAVPVLEWRVNGVTSPGALGVEFSVAFDEVGRHAISVGPPGRGREVLVDTYSVEVTGPVGEIVDGEVVTFSATTNPPGIESEVRWLASTKFGRATPLQDVGPEFSVVFDDTWARTKMISIEAPEPGEGGPVGAALNPVAIGVRWLGVRADDGDFGQDGKCEPGRAPLEMTVPSCYNPATPVPVVVLLHGIGWTSGRIQDYIQLGPLAEELCYILAVPNGVQLAAAGDCDTQFWNPLDRCCCDANCTDDGAYVVSVIDSIDAQYNVDRSRIYVVGHSNGAGLAHGMACRHADTIAGIAAIAGPPSDDPMDCEPSEPVHILQVHGTSDDTIAFEGDCITEPPFGGCGTGDCCYPSADGTAEQWAGRNDCGPVEPDAELLDLDESVPGAETTVSSAASCPAGGSSTLWAIGDGEHSPEFSEDAFRMMVEHLLSRSKP